MKNQDTSKQTQSPDNLKENFTKVPNSVIRHPDLDPYEFRIFCIITSYTFPAFPSYPTLMKLSGCSRDKVNKALKKLESLYLIKRYKKHGSFKVYYFPYYAASPDPTLNLYRISFEIGPPGGLVAPKSVRQEDWGSPPGRLKSVRQADYRNTKEKDQLKKGEFEIFKNEESESGAGYREGIEAMKNLGLASGNFLKTLPKG